MERIDLLLDPLLCKLKALSLLQELKVVEKDDGVSSEFLNFHGLFFLLVLSQKALKFVGLLKRRAFD